MITPRIWPLRTMPNVCRGKRKAKVNEEIVPEGMKPHRYALKLATDKTEDFSIKKIIVDGTKLLIGIYLATFPIVFAWGNSGMQFGGVYTNFRMGFLSIWLLYGRSWCRKRF